MPIEIQIEKKYGKHLPVAEVQANARAYALEQIDRQRKDFKRLGVLADWEKPYLTMSYSNEADELRVLARILKKGFVFRGLKPVNWCFDCGSALAEAEVEYADRKDPSIHTAFAFDDKAKLAQVFGLPEVSDGAIVIWTTTPWTIPANQALNVHPEHDYSLVRLDKPRATGSMLLLATERVKDCLEEWKLSGKVVATVKGEVLANLAFRHPLYNAHEGTGGCRLSTQATMSRSTRVPAWCTLRPPTAWKTSSRARRTAWTTQTSSTRDGRRPLCRKPAAVRRHVDLESQSCHHRGTQRCRRAASYRNGVSQLHALLAPQDARDLPRHQSMVRRYGPPAHRRPYAARGSARGRGQHRVLPSLGPRAPARHDRQTARLDALAANANGVCRWPSSCTKKPARCILAQ